MRSTEAGILVFHGSILVILSFVCTVICLLVSHQESFQWKRDSDVPFLPFGYGIKLPEVWTSRKWAIASISVFISGIVCASMGGVVAAIGNQRGHFPQKRIRGIGTFLCFAGYSFSISRIICAYYSVDGLSFYDPGNTKTYSQPSSMTISIHHYNYAAIILLLLALVCALISFILIAILAAPLANPDHETQQTQVIESSPTFRRKTSGDNEQKHSKSQTPKKND